MANNTFNIDDYLTPAPSVGNSPEQSQQFQSFNIDDYLDITDKDITGLGKKQAAEFGNQLAKFSHATPVQQYQAFEKYGQQYQNHLAQQGYSPTQIAQALTEFNANADPRNQTGLFEYYIGDRGNDVMIGTGNLIGDALAAVPEAIPVLGQWADNAEKYVKNTTKAWQNDLSAKNQINTYLGEKAYQDKRAEGASEFSATLSSLYENPMQVTSLITQQVPQLLLGAAGTATLAGVNMAGAAGRDRKNIEEAYEKTFKENPEQLLKLPEIQERMAQGMTFEQAVNDAKTDVSDHWKSILASALIGGTEALSPLGKFGQGVNRGVLKTLGKEMGQEALQEGAEQLNSNLAVGEIDGKTGAFDEVVRNATLGAVAGLGTGIPTAIEAGLNGRTESDADIDQILNRSAESAKNANAKAQGEFQRANSTNTQSTSEKSSVDEQILESVVSGVADEELRNQYFDELKSSIQDGSIVQAAEQNTAFGRFAKAYMDQAQAKAGVEPQTEQTAQPKSQVNGNVLESILSAYQNDEARFKELYKDMASDIQDGKLQQRLNEGDREYANLARAYLEQTGQLQPQQAVETPQNVVNQPTAAEAELQQTANVVPTQPRNVLVGASDTVDIGENNYQPFQYEVMEAEDLLPTQQKAGNQLRDRERTASQAQVNKIARNLDPRKLVDSPTMDMGAPLLAQDGKTVIAGNGRSMALRQAYQEGNADGYKQYLQANAGKFGLDANQIAGMKNPVLVRRLNTAVDIKQTAINSNEQGGMRMSNLEQAKVDAGRLPNMASFELGENGEINTTANQVFISQFIQNQPETLRNELLDGKGNLSQTGVQRLRNAMLYTAYGDTDTLARAVESTDQGARNIINALTRIAPKVAQVKQDIANGALSDVDISADIVSAVEKYNQLRSQNKDVGEYLQQQDFVSELTPEAKLVLRIFNENNRSARRISDILTSYYNSAETQGNTAQSSMFGDVDFDKAGTLEQAKNADLDARYSRSPIKSVEANIKRGREAMNTAIAERRTVHRAMFNHDLDGWVDFEWGDVGRTLPNGKTKGAMGISHIIDKRMNVEGMSYPQVTEFLTKDVVDTVATGFVTREKSVGNIKSVNIQKGKTIVRLTKKEGNNAWIVTGYNDQSMNQSRGATTSDLRSNSPILSRTDEGATGTDNVQQSNPQSNPQITQDQQTLSHILGEETASHIQVVDRNTQVPSGRDVKQLATKGVEGWFEPSTQKLYIISDNITANDVLSRDERLAWVAFHELAHAGVRIKYGHLLTNVLASASQNVVVKVLARKIQAEHGYEREIAIEEAMMEIYAAYETGNWAELESRYKTKIHESYKQGKNSVGDFLTRVANALRRLIGGIIGKDLTQTMTTSQVFDTLRGIQQGINDIAKTEQNQTASVNSDVRYSLNEEPSSEFAKAVDTVAQGGSVASYVNVGTTPDVLKMLGLPDVKVTIHGSTFKKVMQDKHNVTPETLKQLPKQINDPVAVMKSAPQATQQGYVVLTELVEENPLTGQSEPVVSALHLKQDANGLEIINIASVYGKNLRGLQNMLNHDLLYWNNEKGTDVINTFGLQLPAYALRNQSLQSNIKTEADLSQYQSENSDNNLSETTYNQAKAEGKTELTFQQWKQVRSPEFKAWFGDWENDPENASKVINPKTGEPLVVYHGSNAEFSVFQNTQETDYGYYGAGYYFTQDADIANSYADVAVLERGGNQTNYGVYLNIRSPNYVNLAEHNSLLTGKNETSATEATNRLKSQGFDGVIVFENVATQRSVRTPYNFVEEAVAFNSNQIKSATDNNGQFSSENDDIRFSLREDPHSEFAKQAEPKRRASSFDEARAIVSEFLGEPLVNKATGMVATVSKRSLEKMVSGKAAKQSSSLHDHLMAVANIDSLFENAVNGWTEQHRTNDPNIAGVQRLFAPLLIDGEMKLAKVTVKAMNFDQGNRIYTVETIEVENENGTLGNLEASIDENQHTSPQSANVKSLIQRIKDFNSSDENSDNIRYSVKQSVDDLAKTGKAKQDASQMSKLRSFDGFKSLVKDVGGWLDERVTDGLRPVNDWIDTFKQSGISDHEAERLKDDMYRAKGVRDALNSELESAYLNPIIKKVAAIAKANKMDELSAKRLAGYWISGRYAIEKNNSLLKQDHQAMLDAEKALNEANANGDEEAITLANREYRKAERQYRYRKHDVELALDSDEEFQVGTAGGWSNAEAANFMQNIEKHIPKKDLEALAELVYDLNQKRLEIDHQVGRYTEEQYNEYKANRHYVPLTGDPNADDDFDGISGAGSNALNVSKDRALKGRKLSEAEDGIDASWRAIGKSTTYAGWVDFKNRIDFIYETKVDELVEKGYSTRSAREEVENTLGISKSKMKGLTRSNDDVLIRKVGGEYFEYRLPQKVMQALKNDNVEHANAFLKVLSKPTSWYARGVTQWTITFAPMNMMRDAWEKSEFIRVQKLYDKEGNLLDSKTMDKIGRAVLKNAFLDKSTWAATKRLGFNQTLRDSGSEGLLKQLLKDGGVSTYSTYLAKTETDLIKKLKAENNPLAKKLEQAGALLEGYNKIFDNVSALSAYKALIDHGVDPKQAAAKTLELTNFRKTGSKMRGIKALYMFSQPTAMGARNLIKYLSTPKGQKRFIGYMAVMMPLYAALRALDDDDEGGNKMDQLGDITRYIPLPLGLDKYFKIPVGFGMPQMAWNFSVNMVKAMQSDMPISEAATNMFVHSMKTFAPISPSEISAAKFPLEKLALTATPTILQPLMQNVLNRSAFGSQITTNFVRDDKLKSEQSKATTAQFWKDVAVELNDVLGIDMHPEQIKNLLDGYGSMLGSLKEVQTIFIENPNREQLGRRTRTPFLNQLIGTTNEFAIQSRYYEASEEAQTLANEYNSRKERGKLDGWLDAEKLKIVKWHERNEKLMANTTKEKSKLTRQLRNGTMNANTYEARLKVYNQKMDMVQRTLLNQWREMQGLNTTKSR